MPVESITQEHRHRVSVQACQRRLGTGIGPQGGMFHFARAWPLRCRFRECRPWVPFTKGDDRHLWRMLLMENSLRSILIAENSCIS